MIRDNLQKVIQAIHDAALRRNRNPNDVTLVGVTKFADVPAINEVISAGLSHIAENKVQLAEEKFPKIDYAGRPVSRHMIGHLQTNKVRDAIAIFDVLQSVDSEKLVDEIQKRSLSAGKVTSILVQVDIAREETKFGLPEEELEKLFQKLEHCSNIKTLGLMTMAPLTDDRDAIRKVFRRCDELFVSLKERYAGSPRIQMIHLSMGMSHDFEIAVEEGATMVRVGSAIFKGE